MVLKIPFSERKKTRELRSELNMHEFDAERLHLVCKALNELAIQVRNYKPEVVPQFYCLLKEMYFFLRPILLTHNEEEFDNRFEEIKKKIYDMSIDLPKPRKVFDREVFEELEQLYADLLQWKQWCGLGWRTIEKLDQEKQALKLISGRYEYDDEDT